MTGRRPLGKTGGLWRFRPSRGMVRAVRRLIACTALLAVGLTGWRISSAQAPDRDPRSPSRLTGAPADAPAAAGDSAMLADASDSAVLYDRFCLACHGTHGDGQGPAAPWLWPRPRDFTRGEYKWRTTPSGAPPTDDDLAAAIRHGVPGTSMHAFGASLSEAQIRELVAHLKRYAPHGFERAAVPMAPATPPARTPALVERGKALYVQLGCAVCHGPEGKGDGPAAAGLRTTDDLPAPPYDLTALPLRRPRAPGTDAWTAIYTSIATGLSGTAMPAYGGSVPEEDLWAVAAYLDTLRHRPRTGAPAPDATDVHPTAVQIDREQRLTAAGYWPGHGTEADAAVFGSTIAVQGRAPASLAPAQASLDARQCARCHAKQLDEWRGSLHAAAASPGLLGQLEQLAGRNQSIESCQRCHAPLAEQLPVVRPAHRGGAAGAGSDSGSGNGDDANRRYTANPAFDASLRHQGINCASCHVRGWQRLGPPRRPGSGLLPLPGYPLVEAAIYERADFCLGCHQLPPRLAVAGKPLLNTYREWLEGPYMRRGVQCQHCHMPNREHTWKGVHDPETFRQGIEVEAIAGRSRATGAVSVRARITNVGAGHYLPTTPTPAAWLSVELVDQAGQRIPGAYADKRIGRHLAFERGWVEREDTRIPPGDSLELAAAWKNGAVDRAVAVKLVVRVAPDDYYEGLYRRRLRQKLTPTARAMLEEALRRAEASHYVAVEERIDIASIPGTP